MELLSSVSILLIWMICCSHVFPYDDVSYEELEELDATCISLDTCKFSREQDTLMKYTCHCGSFCSQLDTCCIDSQHRSNTTSEWSPSCQNIYGSPNVTYFMIDKCPYNTNTDSIWGVLCNDSNGEDLMSLVPVTSFYSNLTYKNYFCFRCHEATNTYRYWNIKLVSDLESGDKEQKNVGLFYDKVNHTWMAPVGEEGNTIPVSLHLEIPEEISHLPKTCTPNVVSNCSEKWSDDTVFDKCSAYTSIIHFMKNGQTVSYKNPHCALCNFEDLEKMVCALDTSTRTIIKKPFSFTYLLDINRSDGDKVGETHKCDNGSIWDPFFNKCRILKCALPGYVVQNGKCTSS